MADVPKAKFDIDQSIVYPKLLNSRSTLENEFTVRLDASCGPPPGRTALVAETEPSLSVVKVTLQRNGWNVLEVLTSDDAVRLCSTQQIDVLIAGVFLPHCSGVDIAVAATKAHPGLRVLFCSGTPIEFWDEPDVRSLEQVPHGSFLFLQKPFTPKTLLEALTNLLDGPQQPLPLNP